MHTPDARRSGRSLVATIVAVIALVACGGEPIEPVARAARSLRDLQSGELHLALTATPADGEAASFAIDGPFSVRGDQGDYVVARLRYRQQRGDTTVQSTLISTGSEAWIASGDDLVPLDEEALESLRVDGAADDKPAGLGELDLASWVTDPTRTDGPVLEGKQTRKITGTLDAGRFVRTLAAMAAESDLREHDASGSADATGSGDDALQDQVASSRVEILLERTGDAVRRIDARLRFAGGVPASVAEALGPYAAEDIRLLIEIRRPNAPVTVDAPNQS